MNRHSMRYLVLTAAFGAAVGLSACDKNLDIANPNSGDTKRVLGTPQDAENLLGSYYRRWHGSLYGTGNPPGTFEGMANVMSLMNYSSLANNCQNSRAPFTNASNSNAPGNVCSGEQSSLYLSMNEVSRVTSDIMERMADSGLTLNTTATPLTDARNLRAKSFAEFLRGVSLGYLAIYYDSSSINSPTVPADVAICNPDPLSSACRGILYGYRQVFDSALVAFQRSIDYANAPTTGTGGFPIPNSWIVDVTSMTVPNWIKFIRTYRARIRAGLARTPADRALVDWAAVIADAQNGITVDDSTITSTTDGIGAGWRRIYDGGTTWHQMPPFIIGMADTSGSYATWIAQPLSARGAGNASFFMVTPDTRFPQGLTRAAQQTDFAINTCGGANTKCKRYFANRTSSDQFSGLGFGWSNYDFQRFHSWVTAGVGGTARNGALTFFTLAELNMLEAEGQYRQGNYAAAAALVNKTRVPNGLTAITAFDNTSPVPNGPNGCVPKVPAGIGTGGDGAKVGCGNLWEAIKYEKRIETAYTHFAAWFTDARGWGDLPEKTALFWAVPYAELQARGYAISAVYGAGVGSGNAPNSVSAKSGYGW